MGVCMERSPEMICVILGILKAGAAYVPLDPSYPEERLHFMIEDAQISIVVTVQPAESLKARAGGNDLAKSRLGFSGAVHSGEPHQSCGRRRRSRLSHLHIRIDRGTEGRGGDASGHHTPRAQDELRRSGADDRIAHLAHVCFDAATFEVWGALLTGARLIVISREIALEPELFASELKQQGVSTLFVTTALFNELAAWRGNIFQGIRQVLFGGEAVNPHWVGHVLESGPPRRLVHVYGPTECTTFATFYPVSHVPNGATSIPIGRPISNTKVYVLDEQRQPVPVGVPGELYIGGSGLAQGYLNQPELTRKSSCPSMKIRTVASIARAIARAGCRMEILSFSGDSTVR